MIYPIGSIALDKIATPSQEPRPHAVRLMIISYYHGTRKEAECAGHGAILTHGREHALRYQKKKKNPNGNSLSLKSYSYVRA